MLHTTTSARPLPQAVAWLLSVPGASRTVLDMRIPYSRNSLKDLLGKSPDSYACPGGCWLTVAMLQVGDVGATAAAASLPMRSVVECSCVFLWR